MSAMQPFEQAESKLQAIVDQFATSCKRISVNWRPDGIFASAFLETSKTAIDEWMNYQRFLNIHFSHYSIIKQLLDCQIGIAPNAQSSFKVVAESPNGPTHWVAVIYARQDNILMQTSVSLMNRLRTRVKMHNFVPSQYDEAIAWLLSVKTTN